uniref:Acyl-[acyl-carrier-protein] hydrolase n=1 Tax=Chloropicon roscoffensis TaxID=1461544 RepID=A0A7S3FQ78_9CHLO
MRSAGTTIRGGRGWSGPCSHRPSLGPLRASPVDVAAFAKQTRSSRLVPPPPKLRGEYGSNKRSYVEEYDVREAETLAETDMVSPVVVAKIIESLAIGHFQELSGDRSDVPRSAEMKDLDLTFMLSRITFSFADLPSTSDTIEAETCFKPQKVSFKRDFAVRNKTAGGAAVAAATSTYVLVNFKTRKLSIAPKEMVDQYADFSTKDSSILGASLPRKGKLASLSPDDAEVCSSYVVEASDIDLNGHVGASVYIHWILDSAVAQGQRLDKISSLDVEYKQECFLGERIQCLTRSQDAEDGSGREIDHLVQTEEGNVLLRARSSFHA